MNNDSIETAVRRSEELFSGGWFCAESVLLAVAEQEGIQAEWLSSLATGFCSGTARTGGMCGAVAGGVLAIGLLCGRRTKTQPVDAAYDRVRGFLAAFEQRHGSTNCAELLGCRLDAPEGQRHFRELKLITRCAEFTRDATRMALVASSKGSRA